MQHVDVKVHGNVATLLIDRPEKHGALSPGLLEDLREAFGDVHQEKKVRAVILTAHGDTFCSGVDLKTFQEIRNLDDHEQLQQWFVYWQHLAETCEVMLRFPKPIVAAVDGPAIGAGFALALASDLVVASSRASFAASAVRRGLVGGITTALLAFRLGGSLSARLCFTGESLTAEQAAACGLLSRAPVSSDQVWVAANELAQAASVGSPEAVQATKRVLNESVGEALLTQIAAAAADGATACTTESASEGIDSFIDKRAPKWS